MVYVETKIKVNHSTTLGDSFDDDVDMETIKDLVEQHIDDYCEEHKLDRCNVEVIDMTSNDNIKIVIK